MANKIILVLFSQCFKKICRNILLSWKVNIKELLQSIYLARESLFTVPGFPQIVPKLIRNFSRDSRPRGLAVTGNTHLLA